ncbi:hypothetical protein [Clostridium sp.]|jgi:hypothetical protein|uniref:hypothetical protein n=1 Tax=Clostridium sp. TaxID=1506 RepID=UPI003EEA825E
MGTITLNVSARGNQPPSSTGWISLSLSYNQTHVFTLENFTTETNPFYVDPEGDVLNNIKITSLPKSGELQLNNVAVSLNDEITKLQLESGNFQYVSDSTNQDGYGDGYFKFTVSDVGSLTHTSNPSSVVFKVGSNINRAPSSVGDGESNVVLGNTFVFTAASLTSSLNPPYSDPEGNPPYKLLILSLPKFGKLQLNDVNVVSDQEIVWNEITSGNLKYLSEELPDNELEGFQFMISDTGSQKYIG